ncbi:retrovirus-related Pol polyprotein from transposon 17.6 [Trichonephila clavipes]|nr:retrovirus-related Pol polyprotein from transposon 17.6 [Trichonephila clavipes]
MLEEFFKSPWTMLYSCIGNTAAHISMMSLSIRQLGMNTSIIYIAKVFKSLQEVGLKMNLEKCAFGRKSVKFLGHIVGSGKHSPDPEKVEMIWKLSRPTTKREVRSFLGLTSYYRDYIQNFSQLVLPLTNLTKKNILKDIPWESSAEESFMT